MALPRGNHYGSVHRVLKHGTDPEFDKLVKSFVSGAAADAWEPAAEQLAAYIRSGKAAGLDLRYKKLGAALGKA